MLNKGFLHLEGDCEVKTGFANWLQDANSPPRVENGPDSPVNDKKSRKDSGSPNNASSSSSTPSSKHPKVCINCLNSSLMGELENWLAGCHNPISQSEVSMATLESGNPPNEPPLTTTITQKEFSRKTVLPRILGRPGVFWLRFLAVFVRGLLKPEKFFIKMGNLILVVYLVSKELFFSFFSESHKWQLLSQNQSSDIWCFWINRFRKIWCHFRWLLGKQYGVVHRLDSCLECFLLSHVYHWL